MKNTENDIIVARLAEIDSERAKLLKQLRPTSAKPAAPTLRVPLWTLIQSYLDTRKGKATVTEIVDAMVGAGHHLGKYPLRTVKVCVASPKMSNVFSLQSKQVKGNTVETVTMLAPTSNFKYQPQDRSQQTEPKHAPLTH